MKLISLFESSATFFNGAEFNQELTDRVTLLTCLSVTTQSKNLIRGLKHVNARGPAYADIVIGETEGFL